MTKGFSRMADFAAAMRAVHVLRDAPPYVFEDRIAIDLISPTWRRVVKNPFLSWLVFRVVLGSVYRPVQAQILARSRFAEDKLSERVRNGGVEQFLIVSAGLDSFSVRQPPYAAGIRIYELDHPLTQQEKLRRLKQSGHSFPENVELLEANLEEISVADAMRRSSTFRFERPAVLSWLGTTSYLTRDAIRSTLRSVRENFASDTRIVFDYVFPPEDYQGSSGRIVRFLRRYAARRGEEIIGGIRSEDLVEDARTIGLEVDENLTGDDYGARYFQNRKDDLVATHGSNVISLRVP